jgi:hypothetical protein
VGRQMSQMGCQKNKISFHPLNGPILRNLKQIQKFILKGLRQISTRGLVAKSSI